MDSRKLSDWLQVVASFGVLGGLVFVGLQLRLDRQIALSEQFSSASELMTDFAGLVADHPDVWAKGSAGQSLSPAESAQFEWLARALVRVPSLTYEPLLRRSS